MAKPSVSRRRACRGGSLSPPCRDSDLSLPGGNAGPGCADTSCFVLPTLLYLQETAIAPALPESVSHVIALDVDAELFHVYWHIRWADAQHARQVHPDAHPSTSSGHRSAPLVLRAHDLSYMDTSGANPHATVEIEIHRLAAGCYLRAPGGGRLVHVEIGARLDGRRLAIIAAATPLRLPPGRGTWESTGMIAATPMAKLPSHARHDPTSEPALHSAHSHLPDEFPANYPLPRLSPASDSLRAPESYRALPGLHLAQESEDIAATPSAAWNPPLPPASQCVAAQYVAHVPLHPLPA